MLFSEDIRKTCALCEYAVPIDEDTVLCRKKGPMGAEDTCRKFKYDALKRTPSRPAGLREFTEEDFKL